MTSRTGYDPRLGRYGREESGQRPKFSCHVCSDLRAAAYEDSTKLKALPELDGHVLVDSFGLELKSEALLSVDILRYVLKATDEEVLEDRLETKPFETLEEMEPKWMKQTNAYRQSLFSPIKVVEGSLMIGK